MNIVKDTPIINQNIKRLLIDMLKDYSDILSRHICNDWKWPDYLTEEDKKELLSKTPSELAKDMLDSSIAYDFVIVNAMKNLIQDTIPEY